MGSDWQIVSVKEIAEKTFSGPFGSNVKKAEYVNSGVPIIRGINLSGPRFDDQDYVFVSEEKAESLSSSLVLPKDVVFVARGTVGLVGLVPETYKYYLLSPNLVGLRIARNIADPLYVFYYFRSRYGQNEINSYVSTTGVPKIARALESMRNFRILLPPLPEQRAIAHILGSLDDKIELNRQMNKTLEAMARAIFKSWFVDFDPVRAKAEGRPTGLPDDIAALFPDSFENSEFGEIPKGWEVKPIGSEFNLTMGQSPPGNTYNEIGNGLPFFQGRRDFSFRYPSKRVYCTAPQRLADQGDTLVSVRAPVGDINMAMERCCVGRGVAAVRHKSGSRSYTYYAMNTLSNRFARFDAEGTVFGAINKRQFEELSWLTPGEKLVSEFEKIASTFDEQIEKNTNENKTLIALRDTLLPKLISGELRVPDAEKFVEDAGV